MIRFDTVAGPFLFREEDGSLLIHAGPSEEKSMQQDFDNATSPKENQILEILTLLKEQKEFWQQLRQANVERTEQQVAIQSTTDTMFVHMVNIIDDLKKAEEKLGKQLFEWTAVIAPKTAATFSDNVALAKYLESEKQSITGAKGNDHMAPQVSDNVWNSILEAAQNLISISESIIVQEEKLERVLDEVAPNTAAVAGHFLAAKLIAKAGSLANLAQMPSGTVQLLGAETALFRHLRNTKHRAPKHGIIINHPLLQQAKRERKGKVARAIADKIAIAAKVDQFKGEFVGDKLRSQLDIRLSRQTDSKSKPMKDHDGDRFNRGDRPRQDRGYREPRKRGYEKKPRKGGARSDGRSGGRSNNRSEGRSEGRSGGKSFSRSGPRRSSGGGRNSSRNSGNSSRGSGNSRGSRPPRRRS